MLTDKMKLILAVLSCVYAVKAEKASRAAAFSTAFNKTVDGIPSLRVLPIDPLYPDNFDADFVTLQFVDTNNIVTGLSNCTATDFVLSDDSRVINFQLNCPSYKYTSLSYNRGYILYKYVDLLNTLEINYGKTLVRVYAFLSSTIDVRSNIYYQIGRFVLDVDLIEPLKFNFKNNTSEVSSTFLNDNNIACQLYAREPLWYAIMLKIITNMNKYLRTTAIN